MSGCSEEKSSTADQKKTVHYERGLKYVELEDYESALLEFKNALEVDPRFVAARYQLALTYLKLQQPSNAANEFARTVELDPSNIDARLKLAELLFSAKRLNESKIITQKILEEENGYVDALALLTKILLAENDEINAEKYIDKAIEKEPYNSRLYLIKADILTVRKDLISAENALKKALELEPDSPKNNENLIRFYLSHDQRDKAVELLEDIISAHPKIAVSYIILSQLYEEDQNYAGAEEYLKHVIEVDPENYTSYLLVGNYYRRRQKYEDAETYYNKAFLTAQKTIQVLEVKANLADLYFSQNKYDLADKTADEILLVNPQSRIGNLFKARVLSVHQHYQEALDILLKYFETGEFEYDKAVAYLGAGDIGNAEQAVLKAQKNDPQDEKPQALLAHIMLIKGNPSDAEKYAAEALQKNPNNYKAALTLGESLIAEGKYEKALRHLNQMNQFDPHNVEILNNIGVAQLSLKKDVEAEKTFESILSVAPDDYLALSYLVRIYLNRNDRAGAVRRVEAQIYKVPENADDIMLLGKLRFEDGSYKEALTLFRKAQSLLPDSTEASIMAAKALTKLED
jgi:Tfp pilus assembly protein PilF